MLEKHFEGLERLDHDETPEEALELAVRFSHLIQDPRTRYAILSVLAVDPGSFHHPAHGEDLDRLPPRRRRELFLLPIARCRASPFRLPRRRISHIGKKIADSLRRALSAA
jgi:hypothetical protein